MKDFLHRITSRKFIVTLITLAGFFFAHLPSGKLSLATIVAVAYLTLQTYLDGQPKA